MWHVSWDRIVILEKQKRLVHFLKSFQRYKWLFKPGVHLEVTVFKSNICHPVAGYGGWPCPISRQQPIRLAWFALLYVLRIPAKESQKQKTPKLSQLTVLNYIWVCWVFLKHSVLLPPPFFFFSVWPSLKQTVDSGYKLPPLP